jgi:hypothetical protein
MRTHRIWTALSLILALGLAGCDGDDDDSTAGDDDATAADDDDATAGDDDDATADDDDDATPADDDDDDDATPADDDDDATPADDDDATSDDDDTTPAGTPDIDVSPVALNYGTVVIASPQTIPLVITNTGDADLQVGNLTCVLPPIVFAPWSGSIAPSASQSVDIIANCGVEMAYSGDLIIVSSDPDESPLSIPVTVDCDEA